MRKRFVAAVAAAAMAVLGVVVLPQAVKASPADEYTGTHFGIGNTPPGCENDVIPTGDTPNACHHMKTGLNSLDSNNIDVLIMVPASPTAERDTRIIRQAVEMWDGGIEYLAPQMGLDWMSDVNIEISTDVVSFANGTPIYTYPIVDPEIVIIASNPVGGAGIGIDPLAVPPFATVGDQNLPPGWPCHGVANPFDFEAWEAVPGFDHHHRENSGTYSAECSETGGNICFTVAPAIDPAPGTVDVFNLFDLVSHEFGHCLTLGHVGDGGECVLSGVCWGKVPTNDIMSYSLDPDGLNKCVSTLDVESLATTQSKFIDTNGDGEVTAADKVEANDPLGQPDDDAPFMTQHPRDHFYASGTGVATDCPQPDLGPIPGEPTDWTPDPVTTSTRKLTVTSPSDGDSSADGNFTVAGSVEHVKTNETEDPTEPSARVDDADDDASTSMTEITDFAAEVTGSHVEGTITLAEMPPGGADAQSPTSYSFTVNGRTFDSFVYPIGPPSTFDNGIPDYPDESTGVSSDWDVANKQVNFHIPRAYLADNGITAPYFVSSSANFGSPAALSSDDFAPDKGSVGLAAPTSTARVAPLPGTSGIAQNLSTVEFHNGEMPENTFYTEDSSLDLYPLVFNGDTYELSLADASDVTITLNWTEAIGGSDLDLRVTGAADSGTAGTTTNPSEEVSFTNVKGVLALEVNPYLVTDPDAGVTYTLTAVVTPTNEVQVDTDGDGLVDQEDFCDTEAGPKPYGCPYEAPKPETVSVYLEGATQPLGSQVVDSLNGPDTFSIPVTVPVGTHTLSVVWSTFNGHTVSKDVVVTRRATGPDGDNDGIVDSSDNCVDKANADQANLDGDAKGDACDQDIDGDGHPNGKEEALGTDPRDPESFPAKSGVGAPGVSL